MKFLISICLLVLSISFASHADVEKKSGPGFLNRIQSELNLSVEQKAKLKELKDQAKWGTKAKREAMEKSKAELETLISGQAPEAEVRTKFAELQKLQDEYAVARMEKIMAVRAILTPEQRAKFKNYFDKK